MAATETQNEATVNVPDAPRSPLSKWWVILGFGVLLAVVLGWSLIKDPTISAPTRDPAWYTWRSNLIVGGNPADVAREWGPDSVFSGGYRVATPLTGALMQQVAGIDQYSFSGFLMVLVPVLAGMALGAAGYRSRKDPILVLIAMFAGVTMLLTTPYIGYMDDLTMLFVLCVMLAFITQAQESWGARVALFMLGLTAAYLHPTTCVLFGLSLMAVFGWRVLTSRFHFGEALKRDGPMLMSIGFGMILGLATWVVGIWGVVGNLKDAAAPPPYTKAFFKARLDDWVTSMHPLVAGPLILVAVGGVILWSRRERKPAIEHEISAIWWMLPFAGALTFLVSKTPVPYYRFMNASAAPVVLVGLGTYFLVRWLLDRRGSVRILAIGGVVLVLASVGWMFKQGLDYWRAQPQWANQSARTSLAAINEVAVAAGERPNILEMNSGDANDPATGTNTAYGWAKTYT
ncbi:MAG: hypothetical protein QOE25_371, partial [Actinomycetota bacterium]|nr:hypothetical protein [Actinomycetota bacterium]